MKTVGVRELKNRLSEYLREVRTGDRLLVTDRGEVVAELSPPGHAIADASIPSGLAALARAGLVTLASRRDVKTYPVLPPALRKYRAGQLLDEERGDR